MPSNPSSRSAADRLVVVEAAEKFRTRGSLALGVETRTVVGACEPYSLSLRVHLNRLPPWKSAANAGENPNRRRPSTVSRTSTRFSSMPADVPSLNATSASPFTSGTGSTAPDAIHTRALPAVSGI